jgi:hypothetical protein
MKVTDEQFSNEVDRRIANDLITRDEFKSEIGRVESGVDRIEAVLGTQIGAVERMLNAKLSKLQAWGIAALVGGQAVAGMLASLLAPRQAAHAALHFLHFL